MDQQKRQQLTARCEALMMCNVTTRYAKLFAWGVDHRFVSQLSLDNSPWVCASEILRMAERMGSPVIDNVTDHILNDPLPEGIPDPLKK